MEDKSESFDLKGFLTNLKRVIIEQTLKTRNNENSKELSRDLIKLTIELIHNYGGYVNLKGIKDIIDDYIKLYSDKDDFLVNQIQVYSDILSSDLDKQLEDQLSETLINYLSKDADNEKHGFEWLLTKITSMFYGKSEKEPVAFRKIREWIICNILNDLESHIIRRCINN